MSARVEAQIDRWDVRLKIAATAATLLLIPLGPAIGLYAQVQRHETEIQQGHPGVRERLTRVETVVTELKSTVRDLVVELRRRR